MKNYFSVLCRAAFCMVFIACASCLVSCSSQTGTVQNDADDETMYQNSTLQSLLAGNYDGFINVEKLRSYGDLGLGTFESADGEMIILDGTVFQARYDGRVLVADDSVMVPFAVSTHFDEDIRLDIEGVSSIDSLFSFLTEAVEENGSNLMYAVRMELRDCDSVVVRSVAPQQKPYRPLVDVIRTDQRAFCLRNVSGTLVGVYFPSYMSQLNASGWHCHFISEDRTSGGHLLGISTSHPSLALLDVTPNYALYLPEDQSFAKARLDKDFSAEITEVE